jgi:predicted ferric reductase
MIPAMEFGSMHAILFQLAIIPMTMSRYTLTTLSKTYLNKVIPFNHMTSMHIHLGYTTILIVFLATITFFTFFGLLCKEQKKGIEPRPLGAFTFCDKFTEEIMNTGYGLIAILLILFFTSFFRQKIPYEVFYAVHHLVFGMFGLTIAHTFDDKVRHIKNSSQP